MAMNKKEQAAFEALLDEAARNRALRWSDYCEEPDMPVPSNGDYANGWSFNTYNGTVYPTWSSCIVHGNRREGQAVDDKTRRELHLVGSQNGIRQYSTEARALKALRRAMERDFAKKLAAIDSQIVQKD